MSPKLEPARRFRLIRQIPAILAIIVLCGCVASTSNRSQLSPASPIVSGYISVGATHRAVRNERDLYARLKNRPSFFADDTPINVALS